MTDVSRVICHVSIPFLRSSLHKQYECDFVVKGLFEFICLGRDQRIKTNTWRDQCLKDEGQQSQESLHTQTVRRHTLAVGR